MIHNHIQSNKPLWITYTSDQSEYSNKLLHAMIFPSNSHPDVCDLLTRVFWAFWNIYQRITNKNCATYKKNAYATMIIAPEPIVSRKYRPEVLYSNVPRNFWTLGRSRCVARSYQYDAVRERTLQSLVGLLEKKGACKKLWFAMNQARSNTVKKGYHPINNLLKQHQMHDSHNPIWMTGGFELTNIVHISMLGAGEGRAGGLQST